MRSVSPAIEARTSPPPQFTKFLGAIAVEKRVIVNPEGSFAVDFTKVVEVELTYERLEARVTKE